MAGRMLCVRREVLVVVMQKGEDMKATKDLWIEQLKRSPKERRNLFAWARRQMKTPGKKKEYPAVAVIRGLLALAQRR